MADGTDAPDGVALYASVGAALTRYRVDVAAAALTACETVTLPANVQYAWPHASRRFLYVASSNGASGGGPLGDRHHVSAFAVDSRSGALTPHGAPVALPGRPIHLTCDAESRHVLVAFNKPPDLRVHRIEADGTLGAAVAQDAPLDTGIFPHQVRMMPDGAHAVLVARGNDAASGRAEDPGALKLFRYADGKLANAASIAPGGGMGFGPRHLDFHPSRPWVYVSVERQNRLDMFALDAAGGIEPAARASVPLLSRPMAPGTRQLGGTVHVHPNGRFVYGVNRAPETMQAGAAVDGALLDNSFAVFAIDADSGAPRLVEHVPTGGLHCRCFAIDPTGRLLVAAHVMAGTVIEAGARREVPARLVTFRVGTDGRLAQTGAIDVATGGAMMFWMGMVTL